jgi:D-alanyl-D-alanine carboxypeptidase/D-alanyl-D-alanine-endopeptidase (penicillin-binding protein 4)
MNALLPDSLFPPSNVGLRVISLTRHEVVFDLNPHMLFNPASNEKLLTGATALVTLGEGFPLRTTVCIDTVRKALILRGGGDPLLSTADMDSLAGLTVASLGPIKPESVLFDVSYFDSLYWGAGWAWDEEPAAYGMFISPLILNNNSIAVRVHSGLSAGDPPLVEIDPATGYVSVLKEAVTVADSVRVPLEISRRWRERSNVLTVRGEIQAGAPPVTEYLSLWQPERYAATLFAERLRARGIPVVRVDADTAAGRWPEAGCIVHTLDSALVFMNKTSDNLSAEALLRVLAAETSGPPGTAEKGIVAVNRFLAARKIDTLSLSLADGSGLSRYNLLSPAAVVGLLEAMHADSVHAPAFIRSLPIAGRDGTLARRMRGTAAEGNLRAKTGSMSGVSTLSGYVTTSTGELLAFSMMMQNFPGSVRPYRDVQDAVGAFLAGLPHPADK